MRVRRLGSGPIIDASTHSSIGDNIQGPSLVRAPTWLPNPLGRYLLYFADHKGSYIRLAFADEVSGPWTVHPPGSLQLAESTFLTSAPSATEEQLSRLAATYRTAFGGSDWAPSILHDATTPHIASPDVHVDDANRRFVMYFHGLAGPGLQVSKVALSSDGISFSGRAEVLGRPYLRAFEHRSMTSAMTMPGVVVRSVDGLSGFEEGPTLFEPTMRHCAVTVRGDVLHVLWTRVGDAPESILHSSIDIAADWLGWQASDAVVVLQPELDWEGADAPLDPSQRSVAPGHVNQLRDPAIFDDVDGRSYLLYAVAGESGIALAEIDWEG